MKSRRCTKCRAVLGPWESRRCVSCDATRQRARLTTHDAIVWVLEQEERPIGEYDVRRSLRREFDWNFVSVAPYLSNDPRLCWAGRGLYGLHRHGPIPGPRNLAGVGKFLLYALGDSLTVEELSFIMKFLGYRFQETSLAQALRWERSVEGWWTFKVARSYEVKSELKSLRIAPTFAIFDEMANRYSRLIKKALRERDKRLAGVQGNTT